MAIEPASLTAVSCAAAADRSAVTWGRQLEPSTRLEFAISDGARGIATAVARTAAARDAAAPPLGHGLDLFHTARVAGRVLARAWRRAEGSWAVAEGLERRAAVLRRRGLDSRGGNRAIATAWRRAAAVLEGVGRQEEAWRRARAAFELFLPEGRLNDRARAGSEIGAALADLGGPGWEKVRNFLGDRRSLHFLDRMHRRLEAAEPDARMREAMAWRWWGRHGRPGVPADPRVGLIRAAAWRGPIAGEERACYDRVAAVLRDTTRASSSVECLNGVLRMQRSRHRRMTQGMLDLKRLYWNCRPSRSGPRRRASPYQALGLDLPSFDFWDLLQADPRLLTQTLSTARNAE